MSGPSHLPDDTPSDDTRSGPDVERGVASAGAAHGGIERAPEEATPTTAPVEQVADEPDMTEGREVGSGDGDRIPPSDVPPVEAAESGGAQSDPGARAVDRPTRADG